MVSIVHCLLDSPELFIIITDPWVEKTRVSNWLETI